VTFVSTRAGKRPVTFREAVFSGLAPDGGLYVPTKQADLGLRIRGFSKKNTFPELSEILIGDLLEGELSRESVHRVAERAFTFAPALQPLEDGLTLLELFHGPTCAFKDFGASFLAAVMEEFLLQEDRQAVILVATSGDTEKKASM
jgi:threonine synthase